MTLHEISEATTIIYEEAGDKANIIFGAVIDEELQDSLFVTVIATGFDVDARIKDSINTSQEPVKKDNYDMPTFIRKNETKEVKSQPLSFLDKELPKQADEENNDIEDIDIPAFLRKQID